MCLLHALYILMRELGCVDARACQTGGSVFTSVARRKALKEGRGGRNTVNEIHMLLSLKAHNESLHNFQRLSNFQ